MDMSILPHPCVVYSSCSLVLPVTSILASQTGHGRACANITDMAEEVQGVILGNKPGIGKRDLGDSCFLLRDLKAL